MKRVLFVDDERSVLAMLERRMREHRDRWHVLFAEGAGEALAYLQIQHVDAVVTDMRMPGIDGAALLDIVRDQYPEAVRIVLTGEVETARATRIAALAHRVLGKPSSADAIIDALDRVFAAQAVRGPQR